MLLNDLNEKQLDYVTDYFFLKKELFLNEIHKNFMLNNTNLIESELNLNMDNMKKYVNPGYINIDGLKKELDKYIFEIKTEHEKQIALSILRELREEVIKNGFGALTTKDKLKAWLKNTLVYVLKVGLGWLGIKGINVLAGFIGSAIIQYTLLGVGFYFIYRIVKDGVTHVKTTIDIVKTDSNDVDAFLKSLDSVIVAIESKKVS